MIAPIPTTGSWLIKGILRCRPLTQNNPTWDVMMNGSGFKTRLVYEHVRGVRPVVPWRKLFLGNIARPRAQFTLWVACHGRLATKDRLYRFGMIQDATCAFCSHVESLDHLMFDCLVTKQIWQHVLHWLKISHVSGDWPSELEWAVANSKGKGWKTKLLKRAITKATYEIWRYRNDTCFGWSIDSVSVAQKIIDVVVYRSWMIPKLKPHVGCLMMD